MPKEHFYQVEVNWNENRNGLLSSLALDEKLRVATPPEFPKGEANVWTPEHYFLAAINGCLLTTFLAIADNFKLSFVHFQSTSIGKLEMVNGKYMISEVVLKPIITIANIEDRELAQKVIDKSEKACLISNSIKSEIRMEAVIKE